MQVIVFVGGALVAWLGQWFNAHPRVPSVIVKPALALVGVGLYALVQHPAAWTGEPFMAWLDQAWLWALALPGASSLIGLAPNMQTKNNP